LHGIRSWPQLALIMIHISNLSFWRGLLIIVCRLKRWQSMFCKPISLVHEKYHLGAPTHQYNVNHKSSIHHKLKHHFIHMSMNMIFCLKETRDPSPHQRDLRTWYCTGFFIHQCSSELGVSLNCTYGIWWIIDAFVLYWKLSACNCLLVH
jgi:hypothetical protein